MSGTETMTAQEYRADSERRQRACKRKNWTVSVRCVDCGTAFGVERPDYSVETLGQNRLILIRVPNECPSCHNIHMVSEAP